MLSLMLNHVPSVTYITSWLYLRHPCVSPEVIMRTFEKIAHILSTPSSSLNLICSKAFTNFWWNQAQENTLPFHISMAGLTKNDPI